MVVALLLMADKVDFKKKGQQNNKVRYAGAAGGKSERLQSDRTTGNIRTGLEDLI